MKSAVLITRRRVRRRLASRPRSIQKKESTSDLIDSLVQIHRLLMSGSSLESSVAHAALARPCPAITSVHALATSGQPFTSACLDVIDDISRHKNPTPEDRDSVIALHVLFVAGSIGGRTSDQIESLIDVVNDRRHIRRERRTQAASATASMRLLTWLPIVCGTWMIVDSPAIRGFLLGSPTGWMCLVLGAGSNLLGRMWLRREVATC